MIHIDANVLLRCILNDDAALVAKAKSVLQENYCFAPAEVIAEVVYVLNKNYKIPRPQVRDFLLAAFEYCEVQEKKVMETAITYFSQTTLDFVDCILAARRVVLETEFFSFDKKLNNFIKKALKK